MDGVGVSGAEIGADGVGVLAIGGVGRALRVNGVASFNRSGTLTIASGAHSVTHSGISLKSSSMIFATVQGNPAGVYIRGVTKVVGSSGSFTVHLSGPAPSALRVAFFVLG